MTKTNKVEKKKKKKTTKTAKNDEKFEIVKKTKDLSKSMSFKLLMMKICVYIYSFFKVIHIDDYTFT